MESAEEEEEEEKGGGWCGESGGGSAGTVADWRSAWRSSAPMRTLSSLALHKGGSADRVRRGEGESGMEEGDKGLEGKEKAQGCHDLSIP